MDHTEISSVTKTRLPGIFSCLIDITKISKVTKTRLPRFLQLFNGYSKDIQGYKDKSTKVFIAV